VVSTTSATGEGGFADYRAAITSHSWVHLACHAGRDLDDPDRGGFMLCDGSLTIADLASQLHHVSDLAFLSACETASGSIGQFDEAIHLGAAMQFLGFRHVIATMWSIADWVAPRTADAVYGELTACQQPDANSSAYALHSAVRALLREDPANLIGWTPYIHIGA
jgi:CHAT domain-containing protein